MTANFCPRCGKPQQPSNLFCPKCGLALGSEGSDGAEPPPQTDRRAAPPAAPFPPELLQQLRMQEQVLSRRSRRAAQFGCLFVVALLIAFAVLFVGFRP